VGWPLESWHGDRDRGPGPAANRLERHERFGGDGNQRDTGHEIWARANQLSGHGRMLRSPCCLFGE
jgi:hypothetical protein